MDKTKIDDIKKQREQVAHDPKYQDISYRDKISTINMNGKRRYIHPKIPKGKFTSLRSILAAILLFLLFAFPLIKVNGDPIMMLNLIERKFIIFGIIFWPQDTFILLLMTLSFLLFIILFTVIYGRIFCGWFCPQTIFMESIFRRIENWIEGSPSNRKKLNEMSWNAKKLSKKLSKWVIFYLISFVLVNVILWYFMSFYKWLRYAGELGEHLFGIILIFAFTTAFFAVYTWFREQICIIACPYGRMQSVLADPSTIVISYDYLRGEPRGTQKKGSSRETTGLGDCIDCFACVNVCPTGIDIRNGTQLECVNCTACIDACDTVMNRVDKPKGLIRYASEKEISTGRKNGLSIRVIAYSVVLLGLLTFFLSVLITRTDVETSILRTPGILYQEVGADSLSNLYNIKVVNKTRSEGLVDIALSSMEGKVDIIGGPLKVAPNKKTESVLFIKMVKKATPSNRFKVKLNILLNGEIIDQTEVTFIAPKP